MKQIKPKIIGWQQVYPDGVGGTFLTGNVFDDVMEILAYVIDPDIELFENGKQKVRPVYEEYGDYE